MGTTDFLKLKTITGSTPVNVNTGMGTNFERIDEWASTTETKISVDAAALEAFKGSVIDGADEIWATTQDGIPAGAHGVSRLVTQIRTTITQKVAELTEKITANTTKADANAASIEMLNSNLSELIIKRSASNKVNVSAGAQSYTYITVSLPAGYSVLSVSAVAAHSTTLCGTASISGDRVYIPYSATTAQAPETFSAEIVLLKTP